MLRADPAERITIQQMYQHPWFKKGFPSSVRTLHNARLPTKILLELDHHIQYHVPSGQIPCALKGMIGQVLSQTTNALLLRHDIGIS